jgi:hypothetical protein
MGRHLEKMDTAFMSYVGFLHWEAHHTNPIAVSFCQMLKKTSNNLSHLDQTNKFFYLKRNRIVNKWKLLKVLIRNIELTKLRKKSIK